jgi:hypothetical protein
MSPGIRSPLGVILKELDGVVSVNDDEFLHRFPIVDHRVRVTMNLRLGTEDLDEELGQVVVGDRLPVLVDDLRQLTTPLFSVGVVSDDDLVSLDVLVVEVVFAVVFTLEVETLLVEDLDDLFEGGFDFV